jgi:hypothetical protein
MIQAGDCLRLALETGSQRRIGSNVCWKYLDRNGAAKTGICGFIDFPHPTRPDPSDDFVRPESGWRQRHKPRKL